MNPLTYTFVDCATRSVVASQPAMHLLDAVRAIKADETSQLGARLVNESYVLVSPRADVPSRSGGPWVRAATMQHDGLLIYAMPRPMKPHPRMTHEHDGSRASGSS